MTAWVGGLPPAAHERLERQRASGTAGSLLSAPAAAAMRSAGLAPVGEVFGCLVMNLGWSGGVCGAFRPGMNAPSSVSQYDWNWVPPVSPVLSTAGRGGGMAGFGPYVKAFEHAWNGALTRMLAEARALGAEGVVGVRAERKHLGGQATEFTFLGTAVRSVDTSLTARPAVTGAVWAADLSAEDCAAAILSGLVPRGMTIGLAVTTKHEDSQLKSQRSAWAGNTEIDGMTELLEVARSDARAQLEAHARALGGGDLVVTGIGVREFDTACGNEADLHAEAFVHGTVLGRGPMAPFRRSGRAGPASVLPVFPLTDPSARSASRRRP